MRTVARIALLIIFAGALLGSVGARGPLPAWISVTPAADCSDGCWRLVAAEYWDEQESQGLHHVFARTLNADGSQRGDVAWFVGYPDGIIEGRTKAAPEWGDIALWACFFPDQGQVGPYRTWVEVESRSDRVAGLGLPYCHHESILLTWQWVPEGMPDHRLHLPVIRRGIVNP